MSLTHLQSFNKLYCVVITYDHQNSSICCLYVTAVTFLIKKFYQQSFKRYIASVNLHRVQTHSWSSTNSNQIEACHPFALHAKAPLASEKEFREKQQLCISRMVLQRVGKK